MCVREREREREGRGCLRARLSEETIELARAHARAEEIGRECARGREKTSAREQEHARKRKKESE